MNPLTSVPTDPHWWRTAVIYQIYPRSFADGNGDGIGDLAGVIARLDYLCDLGVDALWLSPFYPSPLADGGYDIADHRDVDPRLGDLSQFRALVNAAHHRQIRIIVDIVPNHTSVAHPWFQAALAAPAGSPERDRYVFVDGLGPDSSQPPSDWMSHFGGSAWEPVGDGQWYLHLFAREQPDLNWANPQVREDFLETLRFWADCGVDGFRVDVAHSLAKDLRQPLRSQPTLDRNLPLDGSDPLYDRDEVHEIYREWRRLFDSYDPPKMAVAETWSPSNSRTYLYARPDELGQVFDFSLLKSQWDPAAFREVIDTSVASHREVGGALSWVLSNHDVPRHASRLALPVGTDLDAWLMTDGTTPPVSPLVALRRARAAALLMLSLPGSAYLYQGEELGLLEVANLPHEALQDPTWDRTDHLTKGRDGCRVPLPWRTTGPSFGFGSDGAWLPQPSWFADFSVETQTADPDSTLRLYRSAVHLRRSLIRDADNDLRWIPSDPSVLHFERSSGWQCIVNLGESAVAVPPGRPILRSDNATGPELPADTAAWLIAGDTP
ncbi:alpha-amylase family glycosyl hydrolase [Branchiibius cervicis]|uniref:Alpha-amylase family glycosyl hydrolase n=1 Tax=Branchiibius cervicis TaxID=908252 RepID=A0ABW2ARG7_9MICO